MDHTVVIHMKCEFALNPSLVNMFGGLQRSLLLLGLVVSFASAAQIGTKKDASILILGGGMTGIIAARTLHERGHDNFIVVDARDELGGRMQTETIGEPGRQFTVERGPNWVQGTQTGNGPKNPILTLTQKHKVKTQFNDLFGSLSVHPFYHYNYHY